MVPVVTTLYVTHPANSWLLFAFLSRMSSHLQRKQEGGLGWQPVRTIVFPSEVRMLQRRSSWAGCLTLSRPGGQERLLPPLLPGFCHRPLQHVPRPAPEVPLPSRSAQLAPEGEEMLSPGALSNQGLRVRFGLGSVRSSVSPNLISCLKQQRPC